MKVLVTGVAGFIGSHVAQALIKDGHNVVGVDNLNGYYDVNLKRARFKHLCEGVDFIQMDLAHEGQVRDLFKRHSFDRVYHLAAQPGVRYSFQAPEQYIQANVVAFFNVLIEANHRGVFMVYASSSSVHGNGDDVPQSLYALTKRMNEESANLYARLHGTRIVGLRPFTVYGPWGRPDMAYWTFAKAALLGTPIQVFNGGDLKRDFTYIDDVVRGFLAVDESMSGGCFDLGAGTPVDLNDFIATLEEVLGRSITQVNVGMQPGDVFATGADPRPFHKLTGWEPHFRLHQGLGEFCSWFKLYGA